VGLLQLEGLSSVEVDELRELLLLHSAAEVVAAEGHMLSNRKGGLIVGSCFVAACHLVYRLSDLLLGGEMML
jgi:hypothetical protein